MAWCMYWYVKWSGVFIGKLCGLVYVLESYVAWRMYWKVHASQDKVSDQGPV